MAKKSFGKSDKVKVNNRQELVDAVILSLKSETSPWHRHWDAGSLAVRNGVSGRQYTGAYNILLLLASAASKNLGDPRWVTFSQASQKGWRLKAGSKKTKIYFWKRFEIKDDNKDDDEDAKIGFTLKSFNMFNLAEMEGAPPLVTEITRPFTPIEAGERILACSPVEIEHVAGIKPHYSLSKDKIFMPLKEHYDKPENYYATLAHEISHSTGAVSRLGRFSRGYLAGESIPQDKRAFEELVAEMSSLFIAAETGLPYEIENHAAYIKMWIEILENDPQVLFAASREAALAADFILKDADLKLVHQNTQKQEQEDAEVDTPFAEPIIPIKNETVGEPVEFTFNP